MSAPFVVRDLGEVVGSWPFVPNSAGTAFSQAPTAVDAQATILGMVREPAAGFDVGGKNFNIYIDQNVTPTQVTFTAGNKTLAQVVSTINTAAGATVAFDDNGFLRLTSTTIGGASFLRLESILGAEDVFAPLGLFSETIARGGDVTQAQHIDPSRGVAGIRQMSLAIGENLEASTFNRGVLQLGFNAGAAEGRLSSGRRTRKVRETIVHDGSRGIQIGTPTPTNGVFTGTAVTPTAAQLRDIVRILDANGREYTRDVFIPFGVTASNARTISSTASGGEIHIYELGWDTSTVNVGQFVNFTTPISTLSDRPRRIIHKTNDSIVIEAIDDTTGQPITFEGSADFEILTGYASAPVRVDAIVESFSAPSTFGSRVEGVQAPVTASTGSVTSVERGNRVVVSDPAVDFTNATPGDLVIWTSAGSSNPWSNNGTYRVKAVIDANTIELVNSDYTPAILNPDTTGGLGTVAVTTDGAFRNTPFLQLAAEGANLAVPKIGETIIVEYYVEDTYDNVLQTGGNFFGPVDPTDSGVASSVRALAYEHDEFGQHTNIRPESIFIGGNTNSDPRIKVLTTLGAIGIYNRIKSLRTEAEDMRTNIGLGQVNVGEYAGSTSLVTPLNTSAGIFVTGDQVPGRAEAVIGFPDSGDLGLSQSYPVTPVSRLWIQGAATRSTLVGINEHNASPATLYMGFHRDAEAGPLGLRTYWGTTATGDGTRATLRTSFMGLDELTFTGTTSVSNQLVLGSNGNVGINLGDVTPGGSVGFTDGIAGFPDRPLHVRSRADISEELIRLEGFSPTATEILMGIKPVLDDDPYGYVGVLEDASSWFLLNAITTNAATASTGVTINGGFLWQVNRAPGVGGTSIMRLANYGSSSAQLELLGTTAQLKMDGVSSGILLEGDDSSISLTGANGALTMSGSNSLINMTGADASITADGANSLVRTSRLASAFGPVDVESSLQFLLGATMSLVRGLDDDAEATDDNILMGYATTGTSNPDRNLQIEFRGFQDLGGGLFASTDQSAQRFYASRVHVASDNLGMEFTSNCVYSNTAGTWSSDDSSIASTMVRVTNGVLDSTSAPCFEVLWHPLDGSPWSDILGATAWTRVFKITPRLQNQTFFSAAYAAFNAAQWGWQVGNFVDPESSNAGEPAVIQTSTGTASPVWFQLQLPDGAIIQGAECRLRILSYSSGDVRFAIIRQSKTAFEATPTSLKTGTPYDSLASDYSAGPVAMTINESEAVRTVDNSQYLYYGWIYGTGTDDYSLTCKGFNIFWTY